MKLLALMSFAFVAPVLAAPQSAPLIYDSEAEVSLCTSLAKSDCEDQIQIGENSYPIKVMDARIDFTKLRRSQDKVEDGVDEQGYSTIARVPRGPIVKVKVEVLGAVVQEGQKHRFLITSMVGGSSRSSLW